MNFKKTIISFSAVVLVIVSVISQATAVSAYNGRDTLYKLYILGKQRVYGGFIKGRLQNRNGAYVRKARNRKLFRA